VYCCTAALLLPFVHSAFDGWQDSCFRAQGGAQPGRDQPVQRHVSDVFVLLLYWCYFAFLIKKTAGLCAQGGAQPGRDQPVQRHVSGLLYRCTAVTLHCTLGKTAFFCAYEEELSLDVISQCNVM
jgi:hypothetical protein